MFILPANNRPSAVTSALQGLSQSSRIIKQGAKEQLKSQEQSRISQLLSSNPEAMSNIQQVVQAVRSGALPEKTGIALIQNIGKQALVQQAANAPYIPKETTKVASGNPNLPDVRGMSDALTRPYTGEPGADPMVSTQMPQQGNPVDQEASGPSSLVHETSPLPVHNPTHNPIKKLEYKEAPTSATLRESGVTEKEHKLNEAARKENNDLYKEGVKENAPIRQQAAKSITEGKRTLASGLRLRELNKKADWDVGRPLAFFKSVANAVGLDENAITSANAQEFQKEVANLLPTYLRNSYAGRILKVEIEEQRKGIVQNTNAPEARKRLIDAIIELGQETIDSGKDYERVVEKYGKADPDLQEHLIELSDARFMKKYGNKKIKVTDKYGDELEITYKDLPEFEEAQSHQ